MIFPYRLDVPVRRLPAFTLLVLLACLVVFAFQQVSESRYERKAGDFCLDGIDSRQKKLLDHIHDAEVEPGCESVFLALRRSKDPDALVARLASEVVGVAYLPDAQANQRFNLDQLRAGFAAFQEAVPEPLTEKLAYRPSSHNPVTMVTSTFAHANWEHLLGNLYFFFAFACCLECVLGPGILTLCFAIMVVAGNLAFGASALAAGDVPTIGLSGVAMGMMAMAAVILPASRIGFVLLSLPVFRTFSASMLRIAVVFAALNLLDYWFHPDAHINYVIHVAGAATGIVLGLCFRNLGAARLLALERGQDDR